MTQSNGFDIVIPARYASTRLPGKPLLDLAGKTLIERVYSQARESAADRVIVATDDVRIADAVTKFGGDVCLTAVAHTSGTDRIAEVIEKENISDSRVIVNLQGDEPFAPPKMINAVAAKLHQQDTAVMATACHRLFDEAMIADPNVVKAVLAKSGNALYFSRAVIPFPRNPIELNLDAAVYYQHIGIYAYRSGFIKQYQSLSPTPLETAESLEQLRVLEHGYQIAVEVIDYASGFGIDTPEDLERARQKILCGVD